MNQCPRCKKPVEPGQPLIQLMERRYHLNCILEHLKERNASRDESTNGTRRGAESDEGRTLDPANTRVN
jgi:hypothetical protein